MEIESVFSESKHLKKISHSFKVLYKSMKQTFEALDLKTAFWNPVFKLNYDMKVFL